jgi:hypothetical protein
VTDDRQPTADSPVSSPEAILDFFRAQRKTVVTFLGYSSAGYEDERAMLRHASAVLDSLDPSSTIVNIGATREGIGAVYELARARGFTTTGIVSTCARDSGTPLSPIVDHVFFVRDASWGGCVPGTGRLSPTSAAIVEASDRIVAIGGGESARDEMTAARRAGKRVRFIPADFNHELARARAASNGQPSPVDFRGEAAAALAPIRGDDEPNTAR